VKIIQAPQTYEKQEHEVACFLAGGCTNNTWRKRIYNELNTKVVNGLVIYDPFNANYDINNSFSQIQWEFNYLNSYIGDRYIFSAYFDEYTNQPMTMYELGRMLAFCHGLKTTICCNKRAQEVILQQEFPVVLSMHENASLKEDLKCQCGLLHEIITIRTPEEHADLIYEMYLNLK